MQFGKMLALGLVLALGGCASFTKDEVAPVTLPSMANYANKPNVYVDFDFYQGEPKSASAVEVPQARDQLKPQLQKILADSGLFGRVTLDEFEKQPGDYSLRLKMYNHPPNAGSMVLAFISGLSMMIIPAYGSDQYTLSLEAQDGQGQAGEQPRRRGHLDRHLVHSADGQHAEGRGERHLHPSGQCAAQADG